MSIHKQSRSTEAERPLSQDVYDLARYHLGGRWGLLVLAVLVLAAGAIFNWSWLIAIGVAPLLIAVLPCLAICALELYMRGAMGKSCASHTTTAVRADDSALNQPATPAEPVRAALQPAPGIVAATGLANVAGRSAVHAARGAAPSYPHPLENRSVSDA